MVLTIRSIDTDAENIARLLSVVESEPISAAVVRDRHSKVPPDAAQVTLFAYNGAGAAVGLGSAEHRGHHPPGRFTIELAVVISELSRLT